jgi:hypothetical protein
MTDIQEENFYDNLPKMSNSKLCEIVVANRYLGAMREEAIASMQELAKRRAAGDTFEYEKHIDELLAGLPKFDLDLTKIMKKIPRMF